MEIVQAFINEYGTTILYAILTGIAAALGAWFKKVYTEKVNTKTKQDVVKTCVQAVEQLYKDLHGEEKFAKCVESVSEMLAIKGITISEIEMQLLIESALAELNKAFEKKEVTPTDSPSVEAVAE